MAKAATKKAERNSSTDEGADSPILDTLGSAVKKMLLLGKEKGYITYDELNKTSFFRTDRRYYVDVVRNGY